ncbi:MAG: hypothetical protein AABZ39_13805 [Spirochaetota bacterium]
MRPFAVFSVIILLAGAVAASTLDIGIRGNGGYGFTISSNSISGPSVSGGVFSRLMLNETFGVRGFLEYGAIFGFTKILNVDTTYSAHGLSTGIGLGIHMQNISFGLDIGNSVAFGAGVTTGPATLAVAFNEGSFFLRPFLGLNLVLSEQVYLPLEVTARIGFGSAIMLDFGASMGIGLRFKL